MIMTALRGPRRRPPPSPRFRFRGRGRSRAALCRPCEKVKFMKRTIFIGVALALLAVGFAAGYVLGRFSSSQTIAMSWGDGKYGPRFYGAHVFAEPSMG